MKLFLIVIAGFLLDELSKDAPPEERQGASDERLIAFCAGLTGADDERIVAFDLGAGIAAGPREPLGRVLAHLFMHQTHHRGQATALLMQAGINPGVTDLISLVSV